MDYLCVILYSWPCIISVSRLCILQGYWLWIVCWPLLSWPPWVAHCSYNCSASNC